MGLFSGKKGVIMGVANEYSIAHAVSEYLTKEGATIGYNHLPDREGRGRMEARVRRALDGLNPAFIIPCDVAVDSEIEAFFQKVKENFSTIDFFVHSIAFAPVDEIRRPTLEVSREGFKSAMDISVYSFIRTAFHASQLMSAGGSMVTMTYFGGERVVGGYNLMGVCKAALESATKYLAYDLGAKGIRVNSVSAGPIKTLAASAVGDFSSVLKMNAAMAPMGRNATAEEVAKSTAYLLSDLSSATTGENIHVDGGYHIMGSPGRGLKELTSL